jgi:hypothetical protein
LVSKEKPLNAQSLFCRKWRSEVHIVLKAIMGEKIAYHIYNSVDFCACGLYCYIKKAELYTGRL